MKTKILVTNLILGIGHLLLSTEIPFYINHISHDRTIQHFSVVLCHFDNTFAGTTIIAIFAPT